MSVPRNCVVRCHAGCRVGGRFFQLDVEALGVAVEATSSGRAAMRFVSVGALQPGGVEVEVEAVFSTSAVDALR